MSRQQVCKSFDLAGIGDLHFSSVDAQDLIRAIQDAIEKAKVEGFDGFYIETAISHNRDDEEEVVLGLHCCRPETKEEQRAREAKEKEREREWKQREQEQQERANHVRNELAKGSLRGLTQKEAMDLWREAQKGA